jgi:hypothetical protein
MTLDPGRLDSLEQTIERLAKELAEAKGELATLRLQSRLAAATIKLQSAGGASPSASAPVPPAPSRPPAPLVSKTVPARSDDGLENLIGRYGALVLAVLTIVMGAGALVSWAISHGLLGPWVRVVLGALLALAIAGTGWWLRTRDSRDFGNVLIALSLAVLNVVAWGAGPRLGLVSPWVSLGVADAAAIALAALALAENEQLLYAVGLGGALIAPFVMTTGEPQYGLLAAYGLLVLVTAIRTIGDRPWWKAVAIVLAGTVVYAIAVRGYHGGTPWVDREFAVAFAGVIGVIALVWERKPTRPWVAVCATATMAIVTNGSQPRAEAGLESLLAAPDIQLFALAGTALFLAATRDVEDRESTPLWSLVVILVPVLFLNVALRALGPIAGPVSGSIVLVWGLAYAAFSIRERGIRRGVLLTAAGFAGLWAISLLLDGWPDAVPPAIAAYAVLLAAVSNRASQRALLAATGVSLLVAFSIAALHLMARTGYSMPFLSLPSLGLASVVVAAFFAASAGLPERVLLFSEERERDDVGVLAASTFAFLWGVLELRRAFSPDASTFLLIAYYAACGVLAIHQGRVRNEGRLRQVGLALAVLAALYAIGAASGVEQIVLRVGSYLLVGAFLLGVAWLYRGERQALAADPAARNSGRL